MSDLTDRLDAIEARIDAAMADAWIDTPDDVPALVAALRGVLRVHEQRWSLTGQGVCRACGAFLDDDRPDCPTVAAITAALDALA